MEPVSKEWVDQQDNKLSAIIRLLEACRDNHQEFFDGVQRAPYFMIDIAAAIRLLAEFMKDFPVEWWMHPQDVIVSGPALGLFGGHNPSESSVN